MRCGKVANRRQAGGPQRETPTHYTMGAGASTSSEPSCTSLELLSSDDFPTHEVEAADLTTSDELVRSLAAHIAKPFRLSAQDQDMETLPEFELPATLVAINLQSNNLTMGALQIILSKPSCLHELILGE